MRSGEVERIGVGGPCRLSISEADDTCTVDGVIRAIVITALSIDAGVSSRDSVTMACRRPHPRGSDMNPTLRVDGAAAASE